MSPQQLTISSSAARSVAVSSLLPDIRLSCLTSSQLRLNFTGRIEREDWPYRCNVCRAQPAEVTPLIINVATIEPEDIV